MKRTYCDELAAPIEFGQWVELAASGNTLHLTATDGVHRVVTCFCGINTAVYRTYVQRIADGEIVGVTEHKTQAAAREHHADRIAQLRSVLV